MTGIEQIQQWIQESDRAVFFGGAGVSTESGIPDFRGQNGLYESEYDGVPPEELLSKAYLQAAPTTFFKFYKEKMLYLDAKPNIAHKKLAEWEQKGHLAAVVTQNIDGLHQAAGSKNVYELHGTVHLNYCVDCGKEFSAEYVKNTDGIPRCCHCGGMVRPDVVLYGEALMQDAWENAVKAIAKADLLIVAGTSLNVYPAASLISPPYFHGHKLVIINKAPLPPEAMAHLTRRAASEDGYNLDLIRVQGSIGEVFSEINIE